MYLFVYGTLKKDEPNHYWMTDAANGIAKFVGRAKLTNKYPLVIATQYNIPFLLDSPGDGKEVSGEVYDIDEKMLGNLDILEDYPKVYTRRQEEVVLELEDATSKSVKAWTYLLSQFRPETINLQQYNSYSSTGPHNLPYIARYLRASSNLVQEIQAEVVTQKA